MSSYPPTAPVQLRQKPWGVIAIGSLLFLLFAMLLLNSLGNKPVSRDEHMYCAVGVLMLKGEHIYKDFAYVSQLPYHPLLLAGVYKLFHTHHYLLVARMITVMSELGAMICILGIFRLVFRDTPGQGLLLGGLGCVLYATNPLVYMSNGYAWNHGVVVLLVLVSLWLFLTITQVSSGAYIKLTIIGLLLTLACGMRITTVLVHVVFLFGAWRKSRDAGLKPNYALVGFLSGTVLAAVWPVYVVSQAPKAFWHDLVVIPRIYGQWLLDQGYALNKLDMILVFLIQPGYLALVVLTIVVWFVYIRSVPKKSSPAPANLWLTTALPLVFLGIALIPPTLWQQYLAVPVPFLILSLAYPYHRLSPNLSRTHKTYLAWFAGACLAVVLVFQARTLYLSPLGTNPKDWVPLQLHKQALTIAEQVEDDGPVLTLGPLWALEGGCDIYPELACGSIVFRIADQLSPEQQRLTRTVGPNTLQDLIAQSPPAAILTGTETGPFVQFEEELIRQRPDWSATPIDKQLVLYREE